MVVCWNGIFFPTCLIVFSLCQVVTTVITIVFSPERNHDSALNDLSALTNNAKRGLTATLCKWVNSKANLVTFMNSSYLHWVQIMSVSWETWGVGQVGDAWNTHFEQVTMSTGLTFPITEILQRPKDEWITKMSIHFSKKKKKIPQSINKWAILREGPRKSENGFLS